MSEFRRLIEHEIPRLRRYARALARDPGRADDLVLETLARALVNRQSWKPGSDIRVWLFKIMHSLNPANGGGQLRSPGEAPDLRSIAAANEGRAARELLKFDRALAGISLEQHEIILLIGLEGMSAEQAAEILRIPVASVRSLLARARSLLRGSLEINEPRDTASAPRAA